MGSKDSEGAEMYKDNVKSLNAWFRSHKDFGTYHHTKQVHGEDVTPSPAAISRAS